MRNWKEAALRGLMSNFTDNEDTPMLNSTPFLSYSSADAQAVLCFNPIIQEQFNQFCERQVLQTIKKAEDRFVSIGGSEKQPKVLIDMLTREYNVLYGFGEERRGYWTALEKQGFHYNARLLHKRDIIFAYNPEFDTVFIL